MCSKMREVTGKIVLVKNLSHLMRESARTVAPNSDTALGQCHANGCD